MKDIKKILMIVAVLSVVELAMCVQITNGRREYHELRLAYEAALGAFVTAKIPMANAAELESLKRAVQVSKPQVSMMRDVTGFKADGSSYTVRGQAPVTDFGIYRRSDGTWFAGRPK